MYTNCPNSYGRKHENNLSLGQKNKIANIMKYKAESQIKHDVYLKYYILFIGFCLTL
jgi:hypothetical protein